MRLKKFSKDIADSCKEADLASHGFRLQQKIKFTFSGCSDFHINDSGFTLIELIVVMIIIGLLSAIVAPKFFGKIDKAKINTTKAQIELLGAALDDFRLDNGRYPTTEEGLKALREKPGDLKTWAGPYLPKPVPKDAWGFAYHYKSPGDHGPYDLFSYGMDGTEGGDGPMNKDIVSWE